MRFPLERFWAFAQKLKIPSKERGSVPLTPLGTQIYRTHEIARGLERGVHYFIEVKGRQQGISTVGCAQDLFWMLDYADMQGLMINDSDENHVYFRDIVAEMLGTLPPDYRLPVIVDNDDMLRFGRNDKGHGGSRLMYQIAGKSKRKRAQLGRGRGINFLHGDEVGYWQDQRSIAGLESALAEDHPNRLYVFGGTANGFDALYEMWMAAEGAVTQHRIFIGWWRDERKRVPKGTPLYDAYGVGERTQDERMWIRLVRETYDFEITDEQVAWRRYQLAERFRGDEDMLAQEHPNLWQEAFVSFGDKFIKAATIRRLRAALPPKDPSGFRYEWGEYVNRIKLHPCDPKDAELVVWEEPEPGGMYILGAKPADEHSDDVAICVFRIYPDLMRQVAEYASKGNTTYQFTWAVIHLAGAYSPTFDAYLNLDLAGTGFAVLKEMTNLRDAGWGLSPEVRHRQDIRDVLSSFREYLFRRPQSFGKMMTRQWNPSPDWRPLVLHGLRDVLERGVMQPRSEALVAGLAAVRRGDDADPHARESARVSAAALAARHYMDTALTEIVDQIPPSTPQPGDPMHVGEFQVATYLHRALQAPPERPVSRMPFWGQRR